MIEVKFNEEKNILIWEHIDVLQKEDIFYAIEKTKEYFNKVKHIKILEINNDIKFGFNVSELPGSVLETSHFDIFESVKHAFVSNTPKNVAFFTVATSRLLSDTYEAQVFSGQESACDWL